MTEMLDETKTGGSPIVSYNIYFDEGTSGNTYTSYAGETDDYMELSYVFTQL